MWKVIDTGMACAQVNMERDHELLNMLPSVQEPILHLYSWKEDSVTCGYFVDPYKYLSIDSMSKRNLNLAKRPTGGGIVFHLCDLAFSVLVPSSHHCFSFNTMENYSFVNSHVTKVVKVFLGKNTMPHLLIKDSFEAEGSVSRFCMAKPTKYDVMLGSYKVGGAAQRRTRHGFLHQGTISIARVPREYLEDVLHLDCGGVPREKIIKAMFQNSYSLIEDNWTSSHLIQARKEVRGLLIESFLGKLS